MNIILLNRDEIQDNNVSVGGRRAEHLVRVLRVQPGDSVRLGVVDGRLGTGTVVDLQRKYPFFARLEVTLDRLPPPSPQLELIVALPRPIMLKRIFSQATALGVRRFHIIHSRRVEKSFWESGLLEKKEYIPHLLHGLEQAAVDTRLPEVVFHRRFKPFIKEFRPRQCAQGVLQLLAHPDGGRPLAALSSGWQGEVVAAVGPEGGWVDYEVEQFIAAGFVCCSVGRRILKVDTAVVALLGAVDALRQVGQQR